MSYADQVFIQNCQDIIQNGFWDTDQPVRPYWEDDHAPAHTVKLFGLCNRYDLSREFPILTLRRTYLKSAVDELLLDLAEKIQQYCGSGQPCLGRLG